MQRLTFPDEWLDEDRQPPAAELRDWLVDRFAAALTVTAARDAQTAEPVRGAVAART